MSYLSVECLEVRTLLASLAGPADLRIQEETWDTPAVIFQSDCIATDIDKASPVVGEDWKAEDTNDETEPLSCTFDGDAGDQKAQSARIEEVSLDSTEGRFEPKNGSEFRVSSLDAPAGDRFNAADAVAADAGLNPGLINPQPLPVGTPASTSSVPSSAVANTGSVPLGQAARTQLPIYFSGASALQGARWKASPEELAAADSLIDVIGSEENESPAEPDAIVVEHQAPIVRADSPTIVTLDLDLELRSDDSDFAPHSAVFAEVASWTESNDLSASATALVVSGSQRAEQLMTVSLPLVPALHEQSQDIARTGDGGLVGSGVAAANVAMPLGRLQSWCVLGGVGLWQIILSARARQKRQPEEN